MLHFILPYIDQMNLYELFDWATVYAAGSDTLHRPKPMITAGRVWKNPTGTYAGLPSYTIGTNLYSIKVTGFVCPSDDLRGIYFNGSTPYALSNYVASVGAKYYWGGGGNPACLLLGVAAHRRHGQLVSDGPGLRETLVSAQFAL